jgi:hypothetical protein
MLLEILSTIKQLKQQKKNNYLYRSGWNSNFSGGVIEEIHPYIVESSNESPKSEKKVDERIEKKPVEVFKEIISEKPQIDLTNLDKKIEMVKKRIEVLESAGVSVSDEKEAISFLEARKKYQKYKDEFKWEITTISSVENLCKKYKLRSVGINSFYKSLPMEAIDELEKFINSYNKVSNITPVLTLIIDEGGKEDKKDPILLAGSPFGKWYYLLGAWDKEVEFVDDLIYHGK